MPWDESYYPRSMRKLPSEVRLKAIEIANALLEEGYDGVTRFALLLPRPRNGLAMHRGLRRLVSQCDGKLPASECPILESLNDESLHDGTETVK
jgi:hypothetical protein